MTECYSRTVVIITAVVVFVLVKHAEYVTDI